MTDNVPTLVCTCGNVMKAPGAKPGRLGKCPKCGAMIRVQAAPESAGAGAERRVRVGEGKSPQARPDPKPSDQKPKESTRRHSTPMQPTAGGYGISSEEISEEAFQRSGISEDSAAYGVEARPIRPPDIGPVKAPVKLETPFSASLSYPLWSWSSIGLLVFLPPILIFTTSPLILLMGIFLGSSPFVLPAYVSMLPIVFFLFVIVGYLCVYLGDILLATATGDVIPPRPPNFDVDIFRALGRWFWAIVAGGVVGGAPAVVYWLNCGEVDWVDRLIFVNLSVIGVAYAQLALLAALLHDDPLAANPVTVLKAMIRLGPSYIKVCLLTMSALGLVGGGLALMGLVENGAIRFVLSWLFWVFTVYTAMVVFRRLGLYCNRQKLIQTWFADRPRWGV